MEKVKILLAAEDSEYLNELEWSLFSRAGKKIEVESITEESCLEQICEENRSFGIIVTDDRFCKKIPKEKWSADGWLFLKTDRSEVPEGMRGILEKEAAEEICKELKLEAEESKSVLHMEKTEGILCYSPLGGSGKTVIALAVAKRLSRQGYQTLYVDAENIQSFQYYLGSKAVMQPEDFIKYITSQENSLYLNPKDIGTEGFDYLLPVNGVLPALGVEEKAYIRFLERILNSRTYDYVVFDTSAELNPTSMRLMEKCQMVLQIAGTSASEDFKVKNFLKHVDCAEEKFMLVCNRCGSTAAEHGKVTIPVLEHAEGRELVHKIAGLESWKGVIG